MVAAQTTNMMMDSICMAPLLNPIAEAYVRQRQREESDCDYYENGVLHCAHLLPDTTGVSLTAAAHAGRRKFFDMSSPPAQNITIIAPVMRFSLFTRSGVKPGTTDPGAP